MIHLGKKIPFALLGRFIRQIYNVTIELNYSASLSCSSAFHNTNTAGFLTDRTFILTFSFIIDYLHSIKDNFVYAFFDTRYPEFSCVGTLFLAYLVLSLCRNKGTARWHCARRRAFFPSDWRRVWADEREKCFLLFAHYYCIAEYTRAAVHRVATENSF